jgi:hypothetical protein
MDKSCRASFQHTVDPRCEAVINHWLISAFSPSVYAASGKRSWDALTGSVSANASFGAWFLRKVTRLSFMLKVDILGKVEWKKLIKMG